MPFVAARGVIVGLLVCSLPLAVACHRKSKKGGSSSTTATPSPADPSTPSEPLGNPLPPPPGQLQFTSCDIAGAATADDANATLTDYASYKAPFDLKQEEGGGLSWVNGDPSPTDGVVRKSDWPVANSGSETYLLRAKFKLTPSTRAYLVVDLYPAGAAKNDFGDTTENVRTFSSYGVNRMRDAASIVSEDQEACISFDPNAQETMASLRIGGVGSAADGSVGKIWLTALTLEKVKKVGTWTRFSVDGAKTPLTIKLLGYYPKLKQTSPDFPITIPADGSMSEWVDASAFAPGISPAQFGFGGNIYYILEFHDTEAKLVTGPKLHVEVTTNPEVEPYYKSKADEPIPANVLLYLPTYDSDIGHRRFMTGLTADLFQQIADRFDAFHPNQPAAFASRYHLIADMSPAGNADRPEIALQGFQLFHKMGFNSATSVLGVLPGPIDAEGAKLHVDRRTASVDGVFYNSYLFQTIGYDIQAIYDDIVTNFEGLKGGFSDYVSKPKDLVVFLFDEIYGPTMKHDDPDYQTALCAYLTGQGQADLVGGDCTSVVPLYSPPMYNDESKPPVDPAADPLAARNWYWKVRFWNSAGADILKQTSKAVKTEGGANFPTVVNTGTPFNGFYNYSGGVEVRELLHPRDADHKSAIDFLWGESFGIGRCDDEVDGTNADFWAAMERPYAQTFGAYVHAHNGYAPHRVLASASRGQRYFSFFSFSMTFGSADVDPVSWMTQAAKSTELLAQVEPFFYDGSRNTPRLAIFSGQTDPMWRFADGEPECWLCSPTFDDLGIHYMLTHSHYPVDFVIEEDVSKMEAGSCLDQGGLDDKRVLFLNRKHVSSCAFAAIQNWLEGGTADSKRLLVLGQELPLYDEYSQLVPDRLAWLNVTPGDVGAAAAGETIKWGTKTITLAAAQKRRSYTLPAGPGTHTVASYETGALAGKDAVVDVTRGTGTIRIMGISAGTQYAQPSNECHGYDSALSWMTPLLDRRPFGYDESLRASLVAPVDDLAIAGARPVVPSDPLVESQLVLDRDSGGNVTGGAVVLINYNNSVPTKLDVEIPTLDGCLTSALDGKAYDVAPGTHKVQLSVTDQEVLGFKTSGACAATYTGP